MQITNDFFVFKKLFYICRRKKAKYVSINVLYDVLSRLGYPKVALHHLHKIKNTQILKSPSETPKGFLF